MGGAALRGQTKSYSAIFSRRNLRITSTGTLASFWITCTPSTVFVPNVVMLLFAKAPQPLLSERFVCTCGVTRLGFVASLRTKKVKTRVLLITVAEGRFDRFTELETEDAP